MVKEKIVRRLQEEGILSFNPSLRDLAKLIRKQYTEGVIAVTESSPNASPEMVCNIVRAQFDKFYGVPWEEIQANIMACIGFDWHEEMNIVRQYWNP